MKGIIFNLLEEVVRRDYGEDTWDALLETAQLEGAYTSLGNYPDQDFMKLVAAASSALNVPADGIVRWFGRNALPLLAERYPNFFVGHKSTRAFLLTLNALLAEYLHLADHGMQAQEASCHITMETAYDPSMGLVEVVPQDLGRVFLNLLNNACYAVHEKHKALGEGFSPTLWVRTTNLGERVEIRIRDNGNGIPPEVREKLFQPFFTTKPAGAGTGLGLSISYDIVVQEHQGEINVDTEVGKYTEFIVTLPKQVKIPSSLGGGGSR